MNRYKIGSLVSLMLSVGVSVPALAATRSSKMTCADFIAMDDVSRPKVVYWFDGFDRKGKPEEVIDFERNEHLVPILVEECTKDPGHLLSQKVKHVQKKTASN